MTRSATLSFWSILPVLHLVFLTSPSGRSTNVQDGVPISALRAYLHDRAELLGARARLFLCPEIVAPKVDTSLLTKELGTAVALMSSCSPKQGRIEREVRGETLVITRSMKTGDTLILITEGVRGGATSSGSTEFSSWGERVALLRTGTSDAWFVASITLTGVERAMDRQPPRAPTRRDSTDTVDTMSPPS
jgi:hypothetical protein